MAWTTTSVPCKKYSLSSYHKKFIIETLKNNHCWRCRKCFHCYVIIIDPIEAIKKGKENEKFQRISTLPDLPHKSMFQTNINSIWRNRLRSNCFVVSRDGKSEDVKIFCVFLIRYGFAKGGFVGLVSGFFMKSFKHLLNCLPCR